MNQNPQPISPLLQVSGVTLQYKTKHHLVTATYRVSFDVLTSDRFVVLGPSGCGKSTILKAVGGYMSPTEGTMKLKGQIIRRPGPDRGPLQAALAATVMAARANRLDALDGVFNSIGDEAGFAALLHWVDREARQADSDKIRIFAMHAGFRRVLRRSGYFQVKSTVEFVVKINSLDVQPSFYEEVDSWHVTLGDSDQDR